MPAAGIGAVAVPGPRRSAEQWAAGRLVASSAEAAPGSGSASKNSESGESSNHSQTLPLTQGNPPYLVWEGLDPLGIPFEWHIRIVSSFYQNSVTHLRGLAFNSTANITENVRQSFLTRFLHITFKDGRKQAKIILKKAHRKSIYPQIQH